MLSKLVLYLGLVILQSMCFVYDQTRPSDGAQNGLVDSDQFIGGQQHVELHRCVFLR